MRMSKLLAVVMALGALGCQGPATTAEPPPPTATLEPPAAVTVVTPEPDQPLLHQTLGGMFVFAPKRPLMPCYLVVSLPSGTTVRVEFQESLCEKEFRDTQVIHMEAGR